MEFVAGVSHELRTPVAVIRSAAENLSQGVVGNADRVKRYGQMIEGEARRLGEMVESVLQYAGIESGARLRRRVAARARRAHRVGRRAARCRCSARDGDVQRDDRRDLPPVIGDAGALRSAVQNLVANAVKYGGADRLGRHPRRARAANSAQPEVRITVEDHGPGIPGRRAAAHLRPVLSRRGRPGPADPRQRSRPVARQTHRDSPRRPVTVATRAGAGSAFTITLPAAEPDTSLDERDQRGPGSRSLLNRVCRRLLLVEDEPGLVMTLTDRLRPKATRSRASRDAANGARHRVHRALRRHPPRRHAAGRQRVRHLPDRAPARRPDADPDADRARPGRRPRRRPEARRRRLPGQAVRDGGAAGAHRGAAAPQRVHAAGRRPAPSLPLRRHLGRLPPRRGDQERHRRSSSRRASSSCCAISSSTAARRCRATSS